MIAILKPNTTAEQRDHLISWLKGQGLIVHISEGHDYTVEGDTYTLTETGAAHAMDHGAPVPIYTEFVNPIGLNLGVEEALTYLDYAAIETIIPNEGDYKSIVGKWAISMIKGEVEILDGLASMRAELVSMGICQK